MLAFAVGVAVLGADATSIADEMEKLVVLRGDAYLQKQAGLMNRRSDIIDWSAQLAPGSPWRIGVAVKAMDFLRGNEGIAKELRDRLKQDGMIAPIKAPQPGRLASHEILARSMILGVGRNAGAYVADLLLSENGRHPLALDYVVEIRDPDSLRSMLMVAREGSDMLKKGALWRLEKYLVGMNSLEVKRGDEDAPFSAIGAADPRWPARFDSISLPSLPAVDADAVFDELLPVFENGDVQERALMAWLLRYAGNDRSEQILKLYSAEKSTWVRAWIVDSLAHAKGTWPAGLLGKMIREESDPGVKGVASGRIVPLSPWK